MADHTASGVGRYEQARESTSLADVEVASTHGDRESLQRLVWWTTDDFAARNVKLAAVTVTGHDFAGQLSFNQ